MRSPRFAGDEELYGGAEAGKGDRPEEVCENNAVPPGAPLTPEVGG